MVAQVVAKPKVRPPGLYFRGLRFLPCEVLHYQVVGGPPRLVLHEKARKRVKVTRVHEDSVHAKRRPHREPTRVVLGGSVEEVDRRSNRLRAQQHVVLQEQKVLPAVTRLPQHGGNVAGLAPNLFAGSVRVACPFASCVGRVRGKIVEKLHVVAGVGRCLWISPQRFGLFVHGVGLAGGLSVHHKHLHAPEKRVRTLNRELVEDGGENLE
mmetsp:Transcript_56328/g.105672  ORF Transcript_56328/g.105672 Transcript_56328/m.105672 type:complete len:210 (-) Transcript_56328:186-815(-)